MRENQKKVIQLIQEIQKVIVGQQEMIQGILIGLFTDGHILIEGLPGLAKTLSVSTTAQAVSLNFQRIQFTPDLLPSDIVGTMVFHSAQSEFLEKNSFEQTRRSFNRGIPKTYPSSYRRLFILPAKNHTKTESL